MTDIVDIDVVWNSSTLINAELCKKCKDNLEKKCKDLKKKKKNHMEEMEDGRVNIIRTLHMNK